MVKLELALVDVMIPRNFSAPESDCQATVNGISSTLPHDGSPVLFQCRNLQNLLKISLVSFQSILASAQVTIQEIMGKQTSIVDTVTLQYEPQIDTQQRNQVHIQLSFRLIQEGQSKFNKRIHDQKVFSHPITQSSIESLAQDSLRLVLKDFQKKIQTDNRLLEENQRLAELLEGSQQARSELELLIKESAQQNQSQITELNGKMKELASQRDGLLQKLTREKAKKRKIKHELSVEQSKRLEVEQENQEFSTKIFEITQLEVESKLPVYEENLPGYSSIVKEFEDRLQEYQNLLESIEEDKINVANENMKLKEELQKNLNKTNSLQHDIKNIEQQNSILINQLAQSRTDFLNLQSKIQQSEKQIEISQNEILRLKQVIKNTQNQQVSLNEDLEKVQQEKSELLNSLLEADQNLATANNEVDKISRELLDTRSELSTVKAKQQLQQSNDYPENLRTQFQQKFRQLKSKLEQDSQQNRESFNKLKQLVKSLQQQNESLQQKLNTKQTQFNSKQAQIQILYQERQQAYSQITKLQHLLCANQDSSQIIQDLRAQNQIYIDSNTKLQQELSSMSQIISIQSKRNQTANKKLKMLKVQLYQRDQDSKQSRAPSVIIREVHHMYVPVPDDHVDLALADYINSREPLQVQFVREDSGIYHYGTKRIFVKLEQGNIIIRVGGGFMVIDEFIEVYQHQQMQKAEKKTRKLLEPTRQSIIQKINQAVGNISPRSEIRPHKVVKVVKDQIGKGPPQKTVKSSLSVGMKKTTSLTRFSESQQGFQKRLFMSVNCLELTEIPVSSFSKIQLDFLLVFLVFSLSFGLKGFF